MIGPPYHQCGPRLRAMQHRMLPGGLYIWCGVCWIIVGQDSLDLKGN
jgi:hypothetical protein